MTSPNARPIETAARGALGIRRHVAASAFAGFVPCAANGLSPSTKFSPAAIKFPRDRGNGSIAAGFFLARGGK
jgi:hypothetical protein